MQQKRFLRLSLGWRIVLGLILGLVVGALFYQNKMAIAILNPIGTIFINLTKP